MAYTPVELRHVKLRRGLFGYRRRQVDRLLAEVIESFEGVWRERADLADAAERLESDLARYREHEQLLHSAILSAERAGAELKEQAKREADMILEEAQAEARGITRKARDDRELLAAEARRIRALLTAALDALDEVEALPEHEATTGEPGSAASAEAA